VQDVWADLEGSGGAVVAEAVLDLDVAVQAWIASYKILRRAHGEEVQHYRDELNTIEEQINAANTAITDEALSARTDARNRYEVEAKAMRDVYGQSIDSLADETVRLQTRANDAGDKTKARYVVLIDSLMRERNVLYQEWQETLQETIEKGIGYIKQSKARMVAANEELKSRLQAEVDHVSASVCQLELEMVACCVAYRDSLDAQMESVNQRALKATGEAKQQLANSEAELQSERAAAEQRAEIAHAAYVETASNEINRIKQKLTVADAQTRDTLVKTIERLQAGLERMRQKLK
jgi:hypothetical protein